MTKEDIIAMAREAGVSSWQKKNCEVDYLFGVEELRCFAALVAAAEREACAKVCDELHWPWHIGDNSGPKECATAIRARGETK